MNGFELFQKLASLDLNWQAFDWLEEHGLSDTYLLSSVILTQNTKWDNVLKALDKLKEAKITSLEQIANLDNNVLALLIKASGFYNTKAKRLQNLAHAILAEFQNLENFKANVSRKWLLNIKGLGYESVDSVLSYLCKREILVVDNYSYRLALALGYELEDYEELRLFLQSGIEENQSKLCEILNKNYALYELYQIFHAQILAFGKKYFKGKKLSDEGKNILNELLN